MPNYISGGNDWFGLTAAEVTTLGLDKPNTYPTAATVASVLSTVRTDGRKALR